MGSSVAQLTILAVMYYILVFIMIFALSYGGQFEGEAYSMQGSIGSANTSQLLNMSIEPESGWDYLIHSTGAFIDTYKFFTFGLDMGLGAFGNFFVTLLFGWLPGLVLSLLVLFAIRGGSG